MIHKKECLASLHTSTRKARLIRSCEKVQYLNEHCEDDDDNRVCDEQLPVTNAVWESEGQGKGHSSSQPTIGQTKLIFEVERNCAEGVNDLR